MFTTHTQELEFLSQQGFPVNPLNQSASDLGSVWTIGQDLDKKRDKLNYPIDGLVVKLDDNDWKDVLGIVGKTPRGWCAIKFPAQEVTTKVLGISWQVGRTGKITPVAELEPVLLQGTTVRRATLHNYKNVVDLGLEINDFVIIRKAGDIIPEILQVVKI